MYRKALFAFVLFSAITTTATADEWEKQFTVSGKPQVTFRADEGHFRVDTWDQKRVYARVVTEGWRISDDEIRITASQSGDQITFELRKPRDFFSWNEGRRRIEIELRIPRSADASLRTSDGHVRVNDLSGKLVVQTSDGHVTLTGVRGEMNLRSSDGHIEGTRLEGSLDASTSDGHITVSGRFDQVDVRTSDGNVAFEVLPGSRVSSVWSLRTTDGNISFRVPDGFNADLEASTSDGRITTDLPITVSGNFGRSRLSGKLNEGGTIIRIRTTDGSIRIGRL